jgi:hypothetical protein
MTAALSLLEPGYTVERIKTLDDFPLYITRRAKDALGCEFERYVEESLQALYCHVQSVAKRLRREGRQIEQWPHLYETTDGHGVHYIRDDRAGFDLVALTVELDRKALDGGTTGKGQRPLNEEELRALYEVVMYLHRTVKRDFFEKKQRGEDTTRHLWRRVKLLDAYLFELD